MDKFLKIIAAGLVTLPMHGFVNASIIGVVTESTATATFKDDVDGVPIIIDFSGAQISESIGDSIFGSAASFNTTSRVGPGVVEFQLENASYGEQVKSVSRSVIDVSFENTGTESVRPTLNSQITPAGMGFYVSDCAAENVSECEVLENGDYGLQNVGSTVAPGMAAIGSYFDFRVVAGDDVLFELTGGLELIVGENGLPNTVVQYFDEVDGFLTNFRHTSPLGSQQHIGFGWDATDFEVIFPDELILNPGQIGTVSYITEVSTFTYSTCVENGEPCPMAYAAFGDPIGRGGTSNPTTLSRSLQFASFATTSEPTIDGYQAGLYRMAMPTFEDGILTYRANSGPGIASIDVPAPSSFALLAMGVAFLTLKRKRYLR